MLKFMFILFRYACDVRVIRLLRERTVGNSPSRLVKQLKEQHSEEWLQKTVQYLTDCKQFSGFHKKGLAFQDPPEHMTIPTYKWIQHVYNQDILMRIVEVKAKVTSVFGTVLQMDKRSKIS
jgi:hypothetical protein